MKQCSLFVLYITNRKKSITNGGNYMTNEKVRKSLFENQLPQWRLARVLGIGESSLTRKLREELPEAEQNELVAIIEEEAKK